MSNVSTIHSVVSYQSGKTKPLDGQRLSKVTYKVDKATGIKPASIAVSVPTINWDDVTPRINELKTAFLGVITKAQDSIVRSKIESGSTSISDDDISIQSVITWINAESGRLTGDDIKAWFDDSIKDSLMLAFASKLGIAEDSAPTTEQSNKLDKIINGYKDSFAKLASGAASFNDMQKENMIKALQFAEDSDSLAARFTERLSKKSDEDLLMSL